MFENPNSKISLFKICNVEDVFFDFFQSLNWRETKKLFFFFWPAQTKFCPLKKRIIITNSLSGKFYLMYVKGRTVKIKKAFLRPLRFLKMKTLTCVRCTFVWTNLNSLKILNFNNYTWSRQVNVRFRNLQKRTTSLHPSVLL